jgi:hypothetical protein
MTLPRPSIRSAPGELGGDIANAMSGLMHDATMRVLTTTGPGSDERRETWAKFFEECADCFSAAAEQLRGKSKEMKDAA